MILEVIITVAVAIAALGACVSVFLVIQAGRAAHRSERAAKPPILVDREGVAYPPSRRVVLKAGAHQHG